jgi:hypothetical protein
LEIELNRETHTYNPDLPSVTEILKDAGLIDGTWWHPEALLRGQYVHEICEYFDEGKLDWDSVDPRLSGYLEAYIDFRRETPMQGAWVEISRRSKDWLYAGTPDRVIVDRPRAIYDLKTGQPERWHGLQLAAYVQMLDDPYSYRRFGLYLKPNGRWRLKEYPRADFRGDLNTFQAALNLYYWKWRK